MREKTTAFSRDADAVSRYSAAMAEHVTDSQLYRSAETILLFLSIPGEPDTRPLIDHVFSDRKTAAVPRICGPDITFHVLTENIRTEKNRFGIPELPENTERLGTEPLPENTLIIVPGLSFAHNGARLGRGKGYYDRFLARVYADNTAHISAAGLCFEFQLCDSLPADRNDMRVTHIVTENGIICC